MAKQICRGIEKIDTCSAVLRTVPDLSSQTEAIAPSVPNQGPPYVRLNDLNECSGIALGSPTRFGNMAAPLKYFWDTSASEWASGALVDKPGIVFTSSSSMHGGQETTLLSMMLPLFHHGVILMGIPYTQGQLHTTTSGGTPYGASHVAAGKNPEKLSDDEKFLCQFQGERLATICLRLNTQ